MRPKATLRVLLPEDGVAGLSVGADVEVLGTRAGTVGRVVIAPRQRMYAEVQVEDQAKVFIRRDSSAVVRKRFGVAGAAYLDVARGTGPELDWNFAVIEATTERAPTETVSAIIDELSGKVVPILDDLGRAAKALADTMEGLRRGDGFVGRVLTDRELPPEIGAILAEARSAAEGARRVLESLEAASGDAARITAAAASTGGGVPALLRRLDTTLATLQRSLGDVARATPRLPQAMRSAEQASGALPPVLMQSQQTARELELLLGQLRGLWLLGGDRAPQGPQPTRPGADRVRP